MSIRGLVDRIGSGMINFIFFERGGELELVAREKTNQKAWAWIQKKVIDLTNNVPLKEWPDKILTVFIVIQDENNISVLQVTQLVCTTKQYKYKDLTSEEVSRISEYVIRNWPDYRELKGVL